MHARTVRLWHITQVGEDGDADLVAEQAIFADIGVHDALDEELYERLVRLEVAHDNCFFADVIVSEVAVESGGEGVRGAPPLRFGARVERHGRLLQQLVDHPRGRGRPPERTWTATTVVVFARGRLMQTCNANGFDRKLRLLY